MINNSIKCFVCEIKASIADDQQNNFIHVRYLFISFLLSCNTTIVIDNDTNHYLLYLLSNCYRNINTIITTQLLGCIFSPIWTSLFHTNFNTHITTNSYIQEIDLICNQYLLDIKRFCQDTFFLQGLNEKILC